MKKKLNETDITNELRGASLFFAQSSPPNEEEAAEAKPRRRAAASKKGAAPAAMTIAEAERAPVGQDVAGESALPAAPFSSAETLSPALDGDQLDDQLMEGIRKAVKRQGKEATFCRFTQEEKNDLGDIVYTYKRNGIRTSENEVIRIAVNWLMENYRTDGQNSVLAQVLDRLNT